MGAFDRPFKPYFPVLVQRHLEKRRFVYLLLISFLYFIVTGFVASRFAFWYDEFFTFHIAKLDNIGQIIEAIGAGAGVHPPLDYIVRHISMQLLNPGEFADRLPSVIAFWIFCFSLYRFVAMRIGVVYGLMAFLAPFVTMAYTYSFWGRSYALLLAASGTSLVAWQALTLGRRRRFNVVLLTLSLFSSVALHYYGAFALIPIAVGETCRSLLRKKGDLLVAGALIGSTLGFVLHLPFLPTQLREVGTFWTIPTLFQTAMAYWWLFRDTSFVLPFFLLFAALAVFTNRRKHEIPESPGPSLPRHEICAALSLLLIPFVCYLVARLATQAFHFRYMLLTIAGAIILLIYLLRSMFRSEALLPTATLLALGLASLYVMSKTAVEAGRSEAGRARQHRLEQLIPDGGAPIVQGNRSAFMEAVTYGSPRLLTRTYYLVDRQASLSRLGNDQGQRAMMNIAPYIGGNVVQYRQFRATHGSFLLINPRRRDWLLPQLVEDGARIGYVAMSRDDVILEGHLAED